MSLLLRDLQLINPNDYSLTSDGIRLLQLGELHDKQPFMNELAKLFLINANYLDIVTIIQSLNDKYSGFSSGVEFNTDPDCFLDEMTQQLCQQIEPDVESVGSEPR
jgi:hypothetical protein